MASHLTEHREGFAPGLTWITTLADSTGIALGVLELARGERWAERVAGETAYLLLSGRLTATILGQSYAWSRRSLFEEAPHCLHVGKGEQVAFACDSDVELALYRTTNEAAFAPRYIPPAEVRIEERGAGQVGGACHRVVRTIFDRDTSPPEARLVLGEVVTLPGRWSSYPPHHHPQPEIYHYRFDKPQGYGHAELGEQVLKVRHRDTVKIGPGSDHGQVAAPGYAMYYAWVIRHLPERPYTAPEFTDEHRWVMEPGAPFFDPKGVHHGR